MSRGAISAFGEIAGAVAVLLTLHYPPDVQELVSENIGDV